MSTITSAANELEAVVDFVDTNGYAIVENAVDPSTVDALLSALDDVEGGMGVRRRQSVYAIRNLLDVVPVVRALSESSEIRQHIDAVLGADAIAVRGILFDKTEDANWTVPWHQDLAIAVRERVEVEGYGGWSVKAGVPHVHPPADVLERMLAVRLHLDDCGLDNGPLEVLPKSHRHGRMSDAEVDRWRTEHTSAVCTVNAGGIILMRPLLLHRSLSAGSPRHRRVVHIEYASAQLPSGLAWYQQAA